MTSTHLYFPANHETFPGWFKGMEVMEQIVREHGLWPVGARNLLTQCKDFKCKEGVTLSKNKKSHEVL